MNLKQVAQKAGLSENALYRYNQGINPKYPTVKAIADVLGVSVDYLLGNTDEMYPTKLSTKEPVDLDEILNEEGMAMFEGQPLSEEYKKHSSLCLKPIRIVGTKIWRNNYMTPYSLCY
ncbi:Helix-turn-helix [Weissella viridescens]|uniref:Helix-turn-helix n=1 Tax=Weissella viridescens TaxID=1629 RepID=A0A380P845_WEIVI|nr:Helix-turn-helix [Weissella viridescens]